MSDNPRFDAEMQRAQCSSADAPNAAGMLLGELIRTSPDHLRAHHDRVGNMAYRLAQLTGMAEQRALLIGVAGWLHDIGMMLVPREILARRGPIGLDDKETIHRHCAWGHEILHMTGDPDLAVAALAALQHQERWDGSGYPSRLCGPEIAIEARIVALCSVYDSLRHPPGHKPAIGHDAALEILFRCNPKTGLPSFDPDLCRLFANFEKEFRLIAEGASTGIIPARAAFGNAAPTDVAPGPHVSRH